MDSVDDGPASALQKFITEIPSLALAAQVNLDNVEDFSKVCRVCATLTEYLIPIFHGEGLQNNLAEKIKKHLPIKVNEQDKLPLGVCYQCAHTLLAWHELVTGCKQADGALRARARRMRQKAKYPSAKGRVLRNKQPREFMEMIEYIVPVADPPRYGPPPAPIVPCIYCPTKHRQTFYNEHLLKCHSNLLFHCEECDSYIDRKNFIFHMSSHADEYVTDDNGKPDEPKRSEVRDLNENVANSNNIEAECSFENDNQENEFSDQSDDDFNFAPLPDSVFEAIEDSEDTEHDSNEATQAVENDDSVAEIDDSAVDIDDSAVQDDDYTDKEVKNSKRKKSRKCPICAKVYTASSSYFYHMKHHHKGTKDHECTICGQKFGTKGSLKQHAPIHTGECRFECKDCKKRFRSNASLYIHKQTHNGIKKWACSQCELSFRWRTHLLRHMKRHSAEKAHVCGTCGRGFNIKCDLLRHARTHSAGNYTCDICGVKFAQSRYLKVHMQKKHSSVDRD